MVMRRDRLTDHRRHNPPTLNEVSMVFKMMMESVKEEPTECDRRVYPCNSGNNTDDAVALKYLSFSINPMTYAIFYPQGESCWQPNLLRDTYPGSAIRAQRNVSILQFKTAQTAIRQGTFNSILYTGSLTEQWIIHFSLQIEVNNPNFIKYE